MVANSKIFAKLGDIQLEVLNFASSLTETHKAKYAEIALLGAKPTLQYLGQELITQKWQAQLSAMFCDVEATLEKLKKILHSGEAHAFSFADGTGRGDFILEDLDINRKQMFNGVTTLAEISFSIKEYVETDPLQAKTKAAIESAPAARLKMLVNTKIIPNVDIRQIGGISQFLPEIPKEVSAIKQMIRI